MSTTELTKLITPAKILRAFNVRRIRDTGVTFLIDTVAIDRFAGLAKVRDKTVIDLGCGPLVLTNACMELGAKHIHGVDNRGPFFSLYEDFIFRNTSTPIYLHTENAIAFDYGNITGVDALQWEFDTTPPLSIIANISFKENVPLLLQYAHAASLRKGIFQYGRVPLTIALSAPVAKDILEDANYPQTRLSTIVNSYFHIVDRFDIDVNSFTPKPRAATTVIKIIPKKSTLIDVPFVIFEQVVKILFASPQQLIGAKLSNVMLEEPELCSKLRDRISFYLGKKVCHLSLKDWAVISSIYYEICKENNFSVLQTAVNRVDAMTFNGQRLSYFDDIDLKVTDHK